ncbi:hypothetical protein Q5691_09755 [Microcoleus sp. w1-18aA5]|uniref:hypothetical protein n=1 Tax=Microcoleus sp. w1-18aA5 TaxID=2818982 RepID=UPI002FD21FD0
MDDRAAQNDRRDGTILMRSRQIIPTMNNWPKFLPDPTSCARGFALSISFWLIVSLLWPNAYYYPNCNYGRLRKSQPEPKCGAGKPSGSAAVKFQN